MKKYIFFLCLTFCFSSLVFASEYAIKSHTAIAYLEKPLPNMVFLDIRTPTEFVVGHIRGAKALNFYDDNFEASLAKLDRDKTYVIYCRTNNRVKRAFIIMQELGFNRVFYIDDGMSGWKKNGYPTVSGLESSSEWSSPYEYDSTATSN